MALCDITSEVAAFVKDVDAVCEATDFERRSLQLHYSVEQVTKAWKNEPHGFYATVGYYYQSPVNICLNVAQVGLRRVLFYDPTSEIVDHRMVRQWLEANLKGAFEDGRLVHTDPSNFNTIFSPRRPQPWPEPQ